MSLTKPKRFWIALTGLPNSGFAFALGNSLLTRSTHAFPRPSPSGPEFESRALGGWRILFAVDREAKRIDILTIDTRGQIYKHS